MQKESLLFFSFPSASNFGAASPSFSYVTCYNGKRCMEVYKKFHARCTKVYYYLKNNLEKCRIDDNFAAVI